MCISTETVKYRGYDIYDSGHGFYLVAEENDLDNGQEPFGSVELAKAAIDRHLDFSVPFHQGG